MLASTEHYSNGMQQGLQLYYHPNGKLRSAYYAENGEPEGYSRYYSTQGKCTGRGYYHGGKKMGWAQDFDSTGSISDEYYYNDNITTLYRSYQSRNRYTELIQYRIEGPFKEYDTTGRVTHEGNYLHGSKQGKQVYYSALGKPYLEYMAWHDMAVGPLKRWDEMGQLSDEELYDQHGVQTGLETNYYLGKLTGKVNYFPMKDSIWATYYGPYGKPVSSYSKLGGDIHGWRTYFDPATGAISGFLLFDQDAIIGYASADEKGNRKNETMIKASKATVITYYPNGKKGLEFELMNGMRTGKYHKYYESGQKCVDFNFINGDLDGSCKEYYQDGKLLSEERYICDSRYGASIFYYPDGKVKAVQRYFNNQKEGRQQFYTAAGVLEGEILFHNSLGYKVK